MQCSPEYAGGVNSIRPPTKPLGTGDNVRRPVLISVLDAGKEKGPLLADLKLIRKLPKKAAVSILWPQPEPAAAPPRRENPV
jgi:hypothetical protein